MRKRKARSQAAARGRLTRKSQNTPLLWSDSCPTTYSYNNHYIPESCLSTPTRRAPPGRGGRGSATDPQAVTHNTTKGGGAATASGGSGQGAGTLFDLSPSRDSPSRSFWRAQRTPSGPVQEAIYDFIEVFRFSTGEDYIVQPKDTKQLSILVHNSSYSRAAWRRRVERMAEHARSSDFARNNFNICYLATRGWNSYAMPRGASRGVSRSHAAVQDVALDMIQEELKRNGPGEDSAHQSPRSLGDRLSFLEAEKPTIELYVECLSDIPADRVARAIDRWIKTSTSPFPPSIGQLRVEADPLKSIPGAVPDADETASRYLSQGGKEISG